VPILILPTPAPTPTPAPVFSPNVEPKLQALEQAVAAVSDQNVRNDLTARVASIRNSVSAKDRQGAKDKVDEFLAHLTDLQGSNSLDAPTAAGLQQKAQDLKQALNS
jgi:hypothetical protein